MSFVKTFQQPLTPQEEREYLQKYREGDLQAKNILIERNLRLVAHVSKKYLNADAEQEDLISIGSIGLIKAVSTFDYTKGSRLATYACRCIENELLMYFRSRKKTSREVSLYEPIGTDREGNEIHLLDIIESDGDDICESCSRKEDVAKLYRVFSNALTEQEQEVIKFRYGLFGEEELTQKVIAKHLNISRSYVSRIEKNALQKLRSCWI